jgi:exopolyphosphatase/guanosine-5'-triphosphate,3'-diphosphate pyrophosphatase
MSALDQLPKVALRPVAVIDIGTKSIRLTIAQMDNEGHVEPLDALSQAVALGDDAFKRGSIRTSTTEECVHVLKDYSQVLKEYGITDPGQVRAIATSAVREASNREAFLDRLFIASGVQVEAIDEAEVNRLIYLAVQPYLSDPAFEKGRTLVVEVGAGTTEILLTGSRQGIYSRSFRLGSLRLRNELGANAATAAQRRQLSESQIHRTIQQIKMSLPEKKCDHLVALGSEMTYAVKQVGAPGREGQFSTVSLKALSALTDELMEKSVDDLMRTHRFAYTDAETLGPTLMAYAEIAEAFKMDTIHVADVTLRDGVLMEMATAGAWTQEFREQILIAAHELGHRYFFDEAHATHVTRLSLDLFRELQGEHQMDERYELILHIAALLHEIGVYVSNRSHHKHSAYLIQYSELFGLGQRDLLLVAMVARYHRRATPKASHLGYIDLSHEDKILVSKMAALLRVADALERSHSQQLTIAGCEKTMGKLTLLVEGANDLTVEQMALKEKGRMFEQVFGMKLVLKPV